MKIRGVPILLVTTVFYTDKNVATAENGSNLSFSSTLRIQVMLITKSM